MLKASSIVSFISADVICNPIRYSCSNILLSFWNIINKMHQNQVRKRTSARLLQKEENSAKPSVTNLQTKKIKHKEVSEEHIASLIKTKRKTKGECVQDEPCLKRTKTERSNGDEHQKTSKRSTVQSKRSRNNISDHDKSALTSEPSKQDSNSAQNEQTLNNKDLLVKYNKRLEDLKQNGVYLTTSIFEILCNRYEMSRNDSKAAVMSKYMRNKFAYFGIATPVRKELNADLWDDVRKLSSCDLRTLAHQTWFSPEREFQYFTVGLLEREMFRMYEDDSSSTADLALKTLNFVKVFIEHPSSWWDTVDALSPNVVGVLVQKYPDELLPEMDKWNVSSCFWLSRTSIIYQLSYKKDTDADRLFRYCLKVADEQEFFIRKAIGWALRQYYRTDPKAVRSFVLKHKNKLSSLSVKEALKHDK